MIHQLDHAGLTALTVLFVVSQLLYTATFVVDWYFMSLPVDWVDMSEPITEPESEWPYIVLFYPVLRELEATMRTTFIALSKMDYPPQRCRVVAIPNGNDKETVASLRRLASEFAFLQILEVPPTTDPSWQVVWDSWDANPKAYWWHHGKRAGVRDLPPKKTRQLIYALYHTAETLKHERNLVIDYIDADSCPPVDHFKGALIGLKHYDVLQAPNVVGNLNATMATSWHAFDHMAWDGYKYPHLSAHGRQPYWVLGKGLFYRVADLLALGGFHPWITIEDPEVGLRYWANGKRLGILPSSLIEEVPRTWLQGITQRKRWICGFFQSLGDPLHQLGLTPWQRFKCWLIFFPCLSLWINAVGVPIGIWALWAYFAQTHVVPEWTFWISAINLTCFVVSMSMLYANTWRRTGLVYTRWRDRAWYMLRVNPISAMIWWFLWLVPLAIGLWMYISDGGLTWQRTEKIDANKLLIRRKVAVEHGYDATLTKKSEESDLE
jgi:cellulose synthase/poly-beta-1,6-N-acetylglucosamine synthase-like glycosyltransferase